MSIRRYKIGDIVSLENVYDFKQDNTLCIKNIGSWNNGDIFGVIIDIEDQITNEHYKEYDVITGCGDKNSNLNITTRIINTNFVLTDRIHIINNAHSMYITNFDDDIKKKEEQINNLKLIKSCNTEYLREQKLERICKLQ